MRPWWARSTTATSLALILAGWSAAVPAAAASAAVERMLAAITAYGPAPAGLTAAQLDSLCGDDPLCAAKLLVAAGGGQYRLVESAAPDTDTIRWVTTKPSVTGQRVLDDGRIYLAVEHFGRKVEAEIESVLTPGAKGVVLDLRGNRGGDFRRMLGVAGRLAGAAAGALVLEGADGERSLALAGAGPEGAPRDLTVLVGPGTASSGEILAALLRCHAGARILGERTAGKDYLLRLVAVDQSWRLLVPAERVRVPGEGLAGGLRPDGPLPEAFRP